MLVSAMVSVSSNRNVVLTQRALQEKYATRLVLATSVKNQKHQSVALTQRALQEKYAKRQVLATSVMIARNVILI